jgi:hypothetical protein
MRREKKNRFVPRVEALEPRDVPTNYYWLGGDAYAGPTNWTDAANWSTRSGGARNGQVPGAADVAIFDGKARANCVFNPGPDSPSTQIEGLTAQNSDTNTSFFSSGFTLTIASGRTVELIGDTTSPSYDAGSWESGNVATSLTINGTLWVGAGTWQYKRGGLAGTGTLDIHNDPSLTGHGPADVLVLTYGPFTNNWAHGATKVGTSSVGGDGELDLSNLTSSDLAVSGNIDVHGTMNMTWGPRNLLTYDPLNQGVAPPKLTIHRTG